METIKITSWSLAVLFFIGLLGESSNAFEPSNTAKGAKGIILKEEYVPGSYCHQKLPAITTVPTLIEQNQLFAVIEHFFRLIEL